MGRAPVDGGAARTAEAAEEAAARPAHPVERGEERTAAEILARYRTEGLVSMRAVAALDVSERAAFVRGADALLRETTMLPVRPLLAGLSEAWGADAEAIVARHLAASDEDTRAEAVRVLAQRGVSSAAILRGAAGATSPAETRAAVANAMSRAPDGVRAEIARLCAGVGSGEARWTCLSARSRAGDAAGRAQLAAAVRSVVASAPIAVAADRLRWLGAELGAAAPFRELVDLIDNRRAPPETWCVDGVGATGELANGGCRAVGHGAPLGDAILRAAVLALRLPVSFSPHEARFTDAQRAEARRLILAAAPR